MELEALNTTSISQPSTIYENLEVFFIQKVVLSFNERQMSSKAAVIWTKKLSFLRFQALLAQLTIKIRKKEQKIGRITQTINLIILVE